MGGWELKRKVLPHEASIQLTRKMRTAKQITVPEACAQILRMRTELTQIYTRKLANLHYKSSRPV